MPRSTPASWQPSRRLVPGLLAMAVALGTVTVSAGPTAAASAPGRAEQLRFMWAVAGQESGWDYYARNASSGAFGRYQIMPFNWPVWSEQYLGDGQADQTPWNQEQVAFGRMRDLYVWLGSWKRVAYWWLTGSNERNERKWSAYARGYVGNIMDLRKKAPPKGSGMPPRTSANVGRGDWRRSGEKQRLRRSIGGQPWPRRGELRDGQVLRVLAARTTPDGVRWNQVVTADGRIGWLSQLDTVPAREPASPGRWGNVTDRGQPPDRGQVRPRPR